ncbi:Fe-S cluster assembly protein SufD [Miltoncostaea marina]|uniref:Fe-S cluster assembly protein SufD n=1 Tax=Miltoncostaea marina TaxID=2843215 RepID=UPI001C3C4F12|nr:Fe-S cluster assembly protein SufD [Miltoncostaea marina]
MAERPTWAADVRDAATQTLTELPALTGREEDWRFTPPADLGVEGPEPDAPGRAEVPELPDGERAATLRLVDGAPAAPALGDLPDGVIVAELGAALTEHEELVRKHLYGLVGFDERPAALNAARWDGGLFVYVPRGVEVTLPVEAFVTATGAAGRVVERSLVVVEDGARATVIERYASGDLAGPLSVSSVMELYAGEGAEVEHLSFIDWGAGVRHHAVVRARAARDARFRSVVVTLGGDVVRVEPTVVCAGPGSDARALGLYFAAGDQHFEHRVVSRHEAPNAYSNLLYKGAIQDRAHTVFFGNLVVPPGAPGTDAYQTNRNLVLNDGARADTIPFLEIETAEVKCSHAGAVGRVDDEHLFYLRSRGVPEADAKRLIVMGFLQEVLEMVAFEELRAELEAAVRAKLA